VGASWGVASWPGLRPLVGEVAAAGLGEAALRPVPQRIVGVSLTQDAVGQVYEVLHPAGHLHRGDGSNDGHDDRNDVQWHCAGLQPKQSQHEYTKAAGETDGRVLADLDPAPPYDELARAQGAHSERVEKPADLPDALARARDVVVNEHRQALLNVITPY